MGSLEGVPGAELLIRVIFGEKLSGKKKRNGDRVKKKKKASFELRLMDQEWEG